MVSKSSFRSTTTTGQNQTGRIQIKVSLANHEDVILASAGVLSPDKVRRTTISGVVDCNAMRLVLPQRVVRELGLRTSADVFVRYGDVRIVKRELVKNVQLKLLDRESVFSAVVEPRRRDALIGAIVLEELDLIVDCNGQQLMPRDPDGIVSEIE